MRRHAPLLAVLAFIAALLGAMAPAVAQVPGQAPPRDQWYAANDAAHWGDGTRVRVDAGCEGAADPAGCSLAAFRDRPFVVMALIDSGINPWSRDFRAPEFTHHPSRYLEGYPEATPELRLSLELADAEGYEAARDADAGAIAEVATGELRWFPGTRIVGGVRIGAGGNASGLPDLPIVDEDGHGTGTASVAGGQAFGANPNLLIVMVEGLGDASVNWATSQPWIDVVSNSWGPGLPGRVGLADHQPTRAAVERGQTVLFSSGNGMYNTNSSAAFPAGTDPCNCKIPTHNSSMTSGTSGPSFVLTIGAASPVNGQAHWWHGIPVDAVSFGSKWRAAGAFDIDGDRDFGGTSCATPITGGALSVLIEEARTLLHDTVAGQKAGGAVAVAAPGVTLPASGPLADGVLTRAEAERTLLTSAQPVPFDPDTYAWDYAVDPTTDAYWTEQGYGVVDRGALDRALAVLRGEAPAPDRADVDQWIEATDAARDALWGGIL